MNFDQLSAARAALWHQNNDAVLTLEAAADWLAATGICSFAPPTDAARRTGKRATAHAGSTSPTAACPAPSFLEAVLGTPLTENTDAEALANARTTAQSLLVRLVAAGDAVLLPPAAIDPATVGAAGTIASSGCFAYVYALRGDRNWRQPPSIFGAQRVSPLSVDAWKQVDLHGSTTAFELGRELGREVTEAASLRSLGELWSQLRVLPIPQLDGAPTKWETAGQRHKQALQTAANASAPMALSALISLYLQSVVAASEDEIASFLQPLAPRNRVIEVVHGLQAARQLDPVVCEGQRLVHVTGMLPEFADLNAAAPEQKSADTITASAEAELESLPTLSVLQQASAFPDQVDEDADAHPAKKSSTKKIFDRKSVPGSDATSARRPYEKKPYEKKSFERKPYERKLYGTRPTGGKPEAGGWRPDEGFRSEKKFTPRPSRADGPPADGESTPRRSYGASNPGYDKPGFGRPKPGGYGRQGFAKSGGAAKSGFGSKPGFGAKPGGFKKREGGFGNRPEGFKGKPREGFGGKPGFERKPREGGFGSKPSFGGKPGFGAKPRRFDDRSEGRPPRSDSRPSAGRSGSSYGGSDSKRSFSKPGGFSKPGFAKPGFKKTGFGAKPGGFKKREDGDSGFKRDFSDKPKRAYTPREGSDRPAGRGGGFKSAGGFKSGGKPGGFKSGGFKTGGKSGGFKSSSDKPFQKKTRGPGDYAKRPPAGKKFGAKKFDKAPRGKKKPDGESRGDE